MYKLDCPICGQERTFSTKWGRDDSKRNNRPCLTCGLEKRKNIRKNFVGQKYNSWTLVDRFKKDGKTHWKIKCKCGNVYIRKYIANITSGKSNQCVECRYKSMTSNYNIEKISNRQFYKIKRAAIKRNINFELNQKDLSDLFIEQNKKCALSGLEIFFPVNKEEMDSYSFTASLDRIDSNKHYFLGNVQWIHKDVNLMKNVLQQDYFIKLCEHITKNNL